MCLFDVKTKTLQDWKPRTSQCHDKSGVSGDGLKEVAVAFVVDIKITILFLKIITGLHAYTSKYCSMQVRGFSPSV